MARFSIKEVANMAGVSPSAVSIVLNGKKGVSAETRQKVQAVIDKLQYTPNPNPKRLLYKKTFNIALIVNDILPIDDSFYLELSKIIQHECESRDYNLIYTSLRTVNGVKRLPNAVLGFDVDGIICTCDITRKMNNDLGQLGIPIIFADFKPSDTELKYVIADYRATAIMAVEYLIGIGHRNIAYFADCGTGLFSDLTFDGYSTAMKAAGLPIDPAWLVTDFSDEETMLLSIKKLLEYEKRPTAFYCCADIHAINAMRCLKKCNIKVPDDISVIGVDDIKLSRYVDPALTTIHINREEMGRVAVTLLLELINGNQVDNYMVNNTLVVRESTKAI